MAKTEKPATTDVKTDEVETAVAPAPAAKKAATRKMLTPAERVAKLEADLAAAREKAEAKANAETKQLTERKEKIVERRDLLNKQIEEIDVMLEALKPNEG